MKSKNHNFSNTALLCLLLFGVITVTPMRSFYKSKSTDMGGSSYITHMVVHSANANLASIHIGVETIFRRDAADQKLISFCDRFSNSEHSYSSVDGIAINPINVMQYAC